MSDRLASFMAEVEQALQGIAKRSPEGFAFMILAQDQEGVTAIATNLDNGEATVLCAGAIARMAKNNHTKSTPMTTGNA